MNPSREPKFSGVRGQGNIHFPCSADHEHDWQPYPVEPYSAICDDHAYIHTYITILDNAMVVQHSLADLVLFTRS